MPVFRPFEDDEQWLPEVDPLGPRASAAPPPGFVTPPFLPAPAPIAPVPPPGSQRPAFDALAGLIDKQPMRSDPQFAPSKTRRVLGGLAGAALAAGEGFVNASGRTRIPGGGGAALADGIVNAKFNKANRAFEDEFGVRKAQADIEQVREQDRRREAESKARIGSETAQEAAARANEAKANRVEAPKPIVVGGKLVSPDGKVVYDGGPKEEPVPQTIDQFINKVRLDTKMTPEEKEAAIKQRLADHNAAHPSKPVSPTAAGLAVAAARGDQEAARALKVLGTYNDKPSSGDGMGASSGADDKRTVDAIINGTLSIKDVSEKRREKIGAMVDARRSEIGPKLNTKQQAAKDKMDAMDSMIEALETEFRTTSDLEGIGRMAGSGLGQYVDETFGSDNNSVGNRATLANIAAELIHEKYGSALSKGENERAKSFIPGPSDPPQVVMTKLRKLKQFHDAKRAEWTKGGGGTPASGGTKKVGDVVTGPDGKRYRITAINGDDVDAEPVN